MRLILTVTGSTKEELLATLKELIVADLEPGRHTNCCGENFDYQYDEGEAYLYSFILDWLKDQNEASLRMHGLKKIEDDEN